MTEIAVEKVESDTVTLRDQFKDEKEKLQLQNLRIKEQMKLQEMKYLSLKEQESKLKEEEMQNRYKQQLSKIKQDLLGKQKEFQGRIIEERKKNKEVEEKLKEVAKQSQNIKMQLQEKEIKEQLFTQLLKEETFRKQRDLQEQEEKEKREAMLEQFRKQQDRMKNQLEKKAMEIFQQQKLKLHALHLEMQRRNIELQEDNKKKLAQIQQLQAEKKKEQAELKQIQQQLEQKQKQIKLKEYISQPSPVQENQSKVMDEDELQEIKQKVKHQLIGQIRKKRQLEEEQDRLYQQQKKKHLRELEEQLRKAMKLEHEEIEKIEEQYKLKSQQLTRQYEQQMLAKQREKEKIDQQSEPRIKQAQYNEPFHLERLVDIDTGLQNKTEEKQNTIIQEPKQPQKQQNKREQIQKRPQLEPQNQHPLQKSQVIKMEEQKESAQDIKDQKIQNKIQPIQPISQSPSKLPSQSKLLQTVKQTNEQVKQKYNTLLLMTTKQIKQIYLQAEDIETYLNKFYGAMAPEVKEMLPFSRKEIEGLFRDKKMDVFDNYSFGCGWFKAKEKKYLLFGSFQSLPLVGAKYGEIQVQQVFIFTKGNAYQKQFLSKMIKIYQKIGYIYQKKTDQQGKYSIKFIIKVPKQMIKQPKDISDQLQIKSTLIFQQHQQNGLNMMKSNCVFYVLTQGLKQLLSEKEKVEVAGRQDFDSKYINKKINDEPFSRHFAKTQKVTDHITELTISLPLKYIQTTEQTFYSLKAFQYELTVSHQKLFVEFYKEERIAIVIHKMQETDVPNEFHLDNYMETKLKRMEEEKQVQIFLPIWENNLSFKAKGSSPQSFTYRQTTKANLAYGSVINSRVLKGDFVFMEAPFVFIVFELNSAAMLRRILFGHIVTEDQVLKSKKTVAVI